MHAYYKSVLKKFLALTVLISAAAHPVSALQADYVGPTGIRSLGAEDGIRPNKVIVGSDGWLYGTTIHGGQPGDTGNTDGYGTVFRVNRAGTEYEVLHAFSGTDGDGPYAPLLEAEDGIFYGTTLNGGQFNEGTIFMIDADGNFTLLESLTDDQGGPAAPYTTLTHASDGNLYGLSEAGGANNAGTFFRFSPTGGSTILHSFQVSEGDTFFAELVEGPDNKLYGVARNGGQFGEGTIFRISFGGTFELLHSFGDGNDGEEPYAPLLLASDGNFYGTTDRGGTSDVGTIFRLTTAGAVTIINNFFVIFDGSVGWNPRTELIEPWPGAIFGTTTSGGANGDGKIFCTGIFGKIEFFDDFNDNPPDPDSVYQSSGLVQACAGQFFAASELAGTNDRGSIYRYLKHQRSHPLDFLCDGKLDLIFQNRNTGALAAWNMNGENFLSSTPFSVQSGGPWRVVGSGDFNLDGDPDLVWQNANNNRIAVWLMLGTQLLEGRFFTDAQQNVIQPGGPWVIAAVADVDGDGKSDLVWQKLSDGRVAVWFLDGMTFTGSALFSNQPGNADWRVTAAPDLDGDGDTDLFWRNINNGRVAGWEMDGINFLDGIAFPDQGGRAWRIVAVQDMDGDGDLDFVWQKESDGRAAIWFLNPDFSIATTALLSQQAGANWQIRNQRPLE